MAEKIFCNGDGDQGVWDGPVMKPSSEGDATISGNLWPEQGEWLDTIAQDVGSIMNWLDRMD